jgi:hypothetical protein
VCFTPINFIEKILSLGGLSIKTKALSLITL